MDDSHVVAYMNGSAGIVELVPERERIHVVARGEIDIATAPELLAAVEEVVRSGFRDVVVDLREVTFIDIIGARALVDADAVATRATGHASFLADEPVRRVLTLTGAIGQLDLQTRPRRRFDRGRAPRGRRRLRPLD